MSSFLLINPSLLRAMTPFSLISSSPIIEADSCLVNARVDAITVSTAIPAPLRHVFQQWRRFDEFPHFMRGEEDGFIYGWSRLVWRIHFDGAWYPWHAEISRQVVNESIFWRQDGGGRPCPNSGGVHFSPDTGGATRITINCEFEPPVDSRPLAESMQKLAVRLRWGLDRFHESVLDEARGSFEGVCS